MTTSESLHHDPLFTSLRDEFGATAVELAQDAANPCEFPQVRLLDDGQRGRISKTWTDIETLSQCAKVHGPENQSMVYIESVEPIPFGPRGRKDEFVVLEMAISSCHGLKRL